ncbi:HD domain-containing protein [Pseudoxanthobacter soli DSM 19599]|uniref:HD domain-containing protein n=1 Tax=Pseudoxanthobacter soli DSM 19599 TaxID=1123029 RepID=A0A1M7ZLT4_9HYPH|nr:YfbR-like 5'-deoxynucleotidase [Pseudoxanthobacter soli]SHO65847.1 HD domain-containing protein [Pseudoxanthobacter soli DSM 19599]
MKLEPHTITTASGRVVNLVDPSSDEIDWHDVAAHLARIPRFNGATDTDRPPYSVAQHSLFVAELSAWIAVHERGAAQVDPDDAYAYGLLHDSPEYAYGDWISPAKSALQEIARRLAGLDGMSLMQRTLRMLDDGLAHVIHAEAGLPWPPPLAVTTLVKRADLSALAIEQATLRRGPFTAGDLSADGFPERARPWPLEPMTEAEAYEALLYAFADIGIETDGVPR